MTTIPQQRAPRRREAICPPWCQGHNDQGYRSWEDLTDGSGRVRMHSGAVASLTSPRAAGSQTWNSTSVEIKVPVEESEDHALTPAFIELCVGNDVVDLTPEAARSFASQLMAAAETAECGR